VSGVKDVRLAQMHTVEPLVPERCLLFEVEIPIEI
jgi:hypothetical protein